MLNTMVAILLAWEKIFAQRRTAHRAIRQALSSLCVLGRRTIARSYLVGQAQGDWSSEYKLHSRCKWEAQDLFAPILKQALAHCPGRFLPLGTDDTRVRKTGKKIPTAHWGRDPLGPPFRVNLQYGLRFLHTSVLLPLHAKESVSARALPVWFEEVAPVRKPGKQASAAEQKAYRQAVKVNNLSTRAVQMMQQLRRRVDEAGGTDKILAFALDGSFCNRTVFGARLERTILIARARKDAKLCFAAKAARRVYSAAKFTPEAVRQDESRAWQSARLFHGGKWRQVDDKEVAEVLWQRGAGHQPLRLLVVRPTPYRKTKQGRLLYRQAAYLLTTDLQTAASELVQIYLDRWQVEVAHREMKQSAGVGQAQVRAAQAVARQPALAVATYSAMHLAGLQVYGAQRPDELEPLPKYQREKARVSYQELIRKMRCEVVESGNGLPIELKITEKSMLAAATV
jgi:hypothetical protein